MFDRKLIQDTALFTLLSLGLGLLCWHSPAVAHLGWLAGTLLAITAGAVVGRRVASAGSAAARGAFAGGVSIAIGCSVGDALRAMPMQGALAATVVGLAAGALAAAISRRAITFRLRNVHDAAVYGNRG